MVPWYILIPVFVGILGLAFEAWKYYRRSQNNDGDNRVETINELLPPLLKDIRDTISLFRKTYDNIYIYKI